MFTVIYRRVAFELAEKSGETLKWFVGRCPPFYGPSHGTRAGMRLHEPRLNTNQDTRARYVHGSDSSFFFSTLGYFE